MYRVNIVKNFIIGVVLVLLLTSCSPSLRVSVEEDGEINYSFSATLKDVVADTVRSFTGASETESIFNGQQIENSLIESGLNDVSVELPDLLSVKISGNLEAPDEKDSQFVDRLPTVPGAIKLSNGKQGQDNVRTLELSLSEKTMNQVLASLPIETAEYVELLSAPIFTGEKISSLEYVELIGAIYGATVAKALEESFVTVEVFLPWKVHKAEALFSNCETKISGASVEFVIPFADFLTQSQEVAFIIQY